jgi:hypothetical protein
MYKRSSRFNRFRKKPKNKSKIGKEPMKFFSVFNPHQSDAPLYPKESEGKWIQVGSIDPAIYNFGLRVERWHDDGRIETIIFSHTNFTQHDGFKVQEVGKENFYYANSVRILRAMCKNYLEDCQFICIESQLSFNYDMTRMMSHIIGVLSTCLSEKGNLPILIEMDPKLKTRLLGAPPMKKKDDVKKWAIVKAFEFFEEEDDQESLEFMREMQKCKKADDVADVKCQLKVMELLLATGVLPKILERPKRSLVVKLKPRPRIKVKIKSKPRIKINTKGK